MSLAFPSNTTVLDNFNRSDEALSDSSVWSAWGGTSLDLVNNAVEPPTTAESGFDIYVTDTFRYCECHIKIIEWPAAPDPSDVNMLWVGSRVSVTGNAYLVELQQDSDGDFSIEIVRVDAGVPTYLGSTVWLTEIADPTNYQLGIRVDGDSIEGYIHDTVSWTKVITRTDSTYTVDNYLAIGALAETGPASDLRIDNFKGGSIITGFPTNHTVLDNFNRPNEGPPPSSHWTSVNNNLKVVNNNVEGTTNDDYNGAYWNTVFNSNCEVYYQITSWPGTPGTDEINFVQAATRIDMVQLNGYVVSFEEDEDEDFYIGVYRLDNGVETLITAYNYLGQSLDPTNSWVGLQSDGSIHRVFINNGGENDDWIYTLSKTDSTYINNGYLLLAFWSSAVISDMSADNFSGGKIRLPRRIFHIT